jgi:preprotein translocase subunit SecF
MIGLVLNLAFLHSTASANSTEQQFAARVKTEIAKLGTGRDARVKVKLKDKTKAAGYVSEISEDSFTFVNEKNDSVTKIQYQQVKQEKGNNLSKGATIAITIGVLVAIGILFGILWN